MRKRQIELLRKAVQTRPLLACASYCFCLEFYGEFSSSYNSRRNVLGQASLIVLIVGGQVQMFFVIAVVWCIDETRLAIAA